MHFKLISDCNAFTKSIEEREVCNRVARWVLNPQEINFKVEHRSGTRIGRAVALSRCSVAMISDGSLHSKSNCVQSQDEELKAIIDILAEKSIHNNFFLRSGLLYKLVNDEELIVLPPIL